MRRRKKRCLFRSKTSPLIGGIIEAVNEAIDYINKNVAMWHTVAITFPRDIPLSTQEFIAKAYQEEGWRSAYWLKRKFVLKRPTRII